MQMCGCFLLHIEMRVHGVQRRVLMTVGGGADAKEREEREKEGRERERKKGEVTQESGETADRPQTSPPHLHLQVHGIRAYCPRTTTDRGSACTRRVSSVPAAADRDRVRREGTEPVASRLSPAQPQTSLIEQGRETQGGQRD